MKKYLIFLITTLAIASLFIGCSKTEGKKIESDSSSAKAEKSEDKDKKKDEAVPVEITRIVKGKISSYQLYNSTIEAESNVDVYNKVSGIITSLKIEEGQYVKKDQILAVIEELDYKLEEAGARSSFEKSKREFDRSKKMYKDKLLSEKDYEQVKYNYEQSRINWEKAKVRLDYTKIRAPIAGILSQRNIKHGDFLQMNNKVFSIVDMNTLITKVFIPEKDISKVKNRQEASITSDALKGEEFSGYIKRISPIVDPNSGTVKVTIGLKEYKNQLKPGMFVKCHIITDTHKNTLLVTKKAVIYNGIQSVIFVVRDGVAHQLTLDVGFQNSENIEALNKDLKPGDMIITVGQYGLKDKTAVKVTSDNVA